MPPSYGQCIYSRKKCKECHEDFFYAKSQRIFTLQLYYCTICISCVLPVESTGRGSGHHATGVVAKGFERIRQNTNSTFLQRRDMPAGTESLDVLNPKRCYKL